MVVVVVGEVEVFVAVDIANLVVVDAWGVGYLVAVVVVVWKMEVLVVVVWELDVEVVVVGCGLDVVVVLVLVETRRGRR